MNVEHYSPWQNCPTAQEKQSHCASPVVRLLTHCPYLQGLLSPKHGSISEITSIQRLMFDSFFERILLLLYHFLGQCFYKSMNSTAIFKSSNSSLVMWLVLLSFMILKFTSRCVFSFMISQSVRILPFQDICLAVLLTRTSLKISSFQAVYWYQLW